MTGQDRYRPERRKTHARALIVLDDALLEARVRDISRDGAKLDVPGWIEAGTAIYFRVGAASLPALVHWMRDGQAGIRFFERLDRETLIALERAADPLAEFR